MQTLPVTPVETLAIARRAVAPTNGNSGIVPPWLATPRPTDPGKDIGIVPPWIQISLPVPPVPPSQPAGLGQPRVLGAANPTGFDSTPALV